MDGEVTIPRSQLERLLEAEMKLEALEAAGVDNWSGYSYALEILQEMEDEQAGTTDDGPPLNK